MTEVRTPFVSVSQTVKQASIQRIWSRHSGPNSPTIAPPNSCHAGVRVAELIGRRVLQAVRKALTIDQPHIVCNIAAELDSQLRKIMLYCIYSIAARTRMDSSILACTA